MGHLKVTVCRIESRSTKFTRELLYSAGAYLTTVEFGYGERLICRPLADLALRMYKERSDRFNDVTVK
jgi:hypothetical protein